MSSQRTQRLKADFVTEIHLHFFDKCAHLFDNFFRRNCHLVEFIGIFFFLVIISNALQWKIHLCVPLNPDSRVEDLVEEGQPLHVGVEVIQLLHSDHLPAVNDEQRFVLFSM